MYSLDFNTLYPDEASCKAKWISNTICMIMTKHIEIELKIHN